MVGEKKYIMHCSKCEEEIEPEETCYQITKGRFVGKYVLFRSYPTENNQYFHEGCLNIL
jgi:hypothetical protein